MLDPEKTYPAFMKEAHRKMEDAVNQFRRATNHRERESAKQLMREAQDGCAERFKEWEELEG